MRHLHPLPHRSGEKPPNTTLCGAPIRAHANIATTTSGIIGMKIPTTSPLAMPWSFSPFAAAAHPEQVGVGDVAFFALLATPVVGDPVTEPGFDVPIQAVVGDVECAIGEPRLKWCVGVVEYRAEGLVPVELTGPPSPVTLGIPRGSPYTSRS